MALSEKAKGKLRAQEGDETWAERDGGCDLTVRFTEGLPDLVIHLAPAHTVRDVKTHIVEARPELADRRLRLIHAGRLLTDGTILYAWLRSLEERQMRATRPGSPVPPRGGGGGRESTDKPSSNTPAAADRTSVPAPSNAWLHCSVGPKIEKEAKVVKKAGKMDAPRGGGAEGREADGAEGEEETETQQPQLQPLRGFDQLVDAGFSREDIAGMRRQFHASSPFGTMGDAEGEYEPDEELDEHARALEEQWIDSLDNGLGDTPPPMSGTASAQTTVIYGILHGFFYPFSQLLFTGTAKPPVFWEDGSVHEEPESVVFGQVMSTGIMLGFVLNVLFGTWRYLLDTS